MNQTEINLKSLSAGELQQLAVDLLPRLYDNWTTLIHSGGVEGTNKTRKGTPDAWCETNEGNMVYIQATGDSSSGKMLADLDKSIKKLVRIKKNNNAICISFLSYDPQADEVEECNNLCKVNSSIYKLYHNREVAKILDLLENHDLRLKYLNIQPSLAFSNIHIFEERLVRKSRKLPFSNTFLGREKDIDSIIAEIKKGNRIIIISGTPGIGKTRFTLELAKMLIQEEGYKDYTVLVLNDNVTDISGSITSEIVNNKRYILIIDDANRVQNLSEVKELIINPSKRDDSLIFLNTRNYNLEEVMSEVRSWGIEGVSTLTLKRMTNLDVDTMLKSNPYNILVERHRRDIITTVKGNPRLAAVMAEVVKNGEEFREKTPYDIFKQYFEGVFSELVSIVDKNTYHEKGLLALISALRMVNISDENIMQKIIMFLDFKNSIQLNNTLSRLSDYEIIDLLPSGVCKIFDDSVSEYLFFRYCFSERCPIINIESLMIEFSQTHAEKILENITSVYLKGYNSEELLRIVKGLPRNALDVLNSKSDDSLKVKHLEWMAKYVQACPIECFDTILRYWRENKDISEYELKQIINIAKSILYKAWDSHLIHVVNLIKEIIVSKKGIYEGAIKEAKDLYKNAFKYLAPLQIDENWSKWFYGHQQCALNVIDRWIEKNASDCEIEIALIILKELCSHHYSDDHMDYIDNKKYVMSSGALAITDNLKHLRKATFECLNLIYSRVCDVKIKILVLEAWKQPFEQMLPYGGSPSKELMDFDSDIIVNILSGICSQENHLLLKDKLYDLLKRIDRMGYKIKVQPLISQINNQDLIEYRKLIGSYWNRLELKLDYSESERIKREFIKEYIAGITLDNYKEKVIKLEAFHAYCCIDGKEHNILLADVFLEITKNNPILGSIFIKDIEEIPELSSLDAYFHNILTGLGISSPDLKREVCLRYISKKDIKKCRGISWSFYWSNQPKAYSDDKSIIDALVALEDTSIDFHIVSGLQKFEEIDREWVIGHLHTITNRCNERTYSDLLMWLEPRHDADNSYKVWHTNFDEFVEIVFKTYKLPDISEFDFHLANCLKYIVEIKGIESIFEYFKLRIDEKVRTKSYNYDIIPSYHQSHMNFINENNGISNVYNKFLAKAHEYKEYSHDIIELVAKLIENYESEDLYNVVLSWIKSGDSAKIDMIIELLAEVPKSKFWFNIIEQVVIITTDIQKWRRMIRIFEESSMWGPFSEYYQGKVNMVRERKSDYSSLEMQRFLDYVEQYFVKKVSWELERESHENDEEYI